MKKISKNKTRLKPYAEALSLLPFGSESLYISLLQEMYSREHVGVIKNCLLYADKGNYRVLCGNILPGEEIFYLTPYNAKDLAVCLINKMCGNSYSFNFDGCIKRFDMSDLLDMGFDESDISFFTEVSSCQALLSKIDVNHPLYSHYVRCLDFYVNDGDTASIKKLISIISSVSSKPNFANIRRKSPKKYSLEEDAIISNFDMIQDFVRLCLPNSRRDTPFKLCIYDKYSLNRVIDNSIVCGDYVCSISWTSVMDILRDFELRRKGMPIVGNKISYLWVFVTNDVLNNLTLYTYNTKM